MDKLTDAVIFSRRYVVSFSDSQTKTEIEEFAKQLIQQISTPLSYNGIILGHIKLLAKISEEIFLFLSVTKLDLIDIKASSQWSGDCSLKTAKCFFDLNILVYGHSLQDIEETVAEAFGGVAGVRAETVMGE